MSTDAALMAKAEELAIQGVDVEQMLADILSEEIEKEFKAAGMLTSKERDEMIIAEMIRLHNEDTQCHQNLSKD